MLINPYIFEKLIAPISIEDFFLNYWEKKPLVLRDRAKGYEPIISLDEVEQLLMTLTAAHNAPTGQVPWLRLVNNKKELNVEDYLIKENHLVTPRLSSEKILKGYRDGNTIVLNSLHLRHEPINKMCCHLEEVFGQPFKTNLYLTPPNAQGFGAHFDPHDVFILQIEGEKLWKIYDSYVPFPIQTTDTPFEKVGPPIHEFFLKPGDLLYLPRGYVHEASTSKNHSLHLTVGLYAITWADLISEVARNTQSLRQALPKNMLNRNEYYALDNEVKEAFLQACQNPTVIDKAFQSLRKNWGKRKIKSTRIGLKEPFQELDANALLRKKKGLVCTLTTQGEHTTMRFGTEIITGPSHIETTLQYIIDNLTFSINTLPDFLTAAGKTNLIKALFKSGVLELED